MGNENAQKTPDIRTIIAIVVLISGVVMAYAALKYHSHDERYMPRETLELRLEKLQESACRIEELVEKHDDRHDADRRRASP